MVAMTSAMILGQAAIEMVITITRIGLDTYILIGIIMMIGCTRTMTVRTAGLSSRLSFFLLREVLVPMSFLS